MCQFVVNGFMFFILFCFSVQLCHCSTLRHIVSYYLIYAVSIAAILQKPTYVHSTTHHQRHQHSHKKQTNIQQTTTLSLSKNGAGHPLSMYEPVHSFADGLKCSCPLPQKQSPLQPPKFAQPPTYPAPSLPQQAAMNSNALSSPKPCSVRLHSPSDSLIITFLG